MFKLVAEKILDINDGMEGILVAKYPTHQHIFFSDNGKRIQL